MAGGGSYQAEDDGVYGINVTPLVDVMLVLLVIFMVTAPAIARRGIAFQEPQTTTAGTVDSSLEIIIDESRTIYIGGEELPDLDAVRSKVAGARGEDPEVKALITADIRVPHGDVMALVDTIKLAGVRKFAFASERVRPE